MKSFVFFLGLVALCLGGGCSDGGDADPDGGSGVDTDTSDHITGWLHIAGNKIYHNDGTVYHGRGADMHDTRGCNGCTWFEPNVDEVKRRIDALVDDWGANFMRLVLESYATADGRVHWAGPLDDPDYLADIIEIVEYVGTKPGVYALVSLWTHPSLDDMGWPTEETITVWEAVSAELVKYPHVMFGVCNEPQRNSDGALDGEVWDWMNRVAAAIRAVEAAHASPKHIIAVQGTRSWGRHLGYYVDHPITAGGGENIAYETHSYMPESHFQENWIGPSDTLPVIIGEFAPFEMTVQDTIAMMDAADVRDISWSAWTFHQRCGSGISLLVDHNGSGCGVDMELTPSEWGTVIKNRLAGYGKIQ